jgi:hypothetical protein
MFQVSLKLNKNNGYFTWRLIQTSIVEKIKTHILCSITFFQKLHHFLDNVEKHCRTRQATDDSMVHGHCMLDTWDYKYTLRLYNTYCFSTVAMVAWTCLTVSDTYIAYLVCFSVIQCLEDKMNLCCKKICTKLKWSFVPTLKRRRLHVGNETLQVKQMATINPFHMTFCIFICLDKLQKTNFHTVNIVWHHLNLIHLLINGLFNERMVQTINPLTPNDL